MAERAIFLDRDNTIIDNDGYLGDPSKVKLLPGAGTAIAALRRLGYKIIVVSNQSGVARGMYTEADVKLVDAEMYRQLKQTAEAIIDASYYCAYHPAGVVPEYTREHDWRKPKPGMLTQAAEDFRLDLSQSWMIGDMPRDIAAGLSAGCRTILLQDPENPSKANGSGGGEEATPHYTVRTLADAARIISRDGRGIFRPQSTNPYEVPMANPVAPIVEAPPATPSPLENPPPSPFAEVALMPAPTPRVETPVAGAPSGRTEKLLEELITLMRHQQRAHDYHGEFSLATFGAVILQFAAVSMMIIGVVSSLNFSGESQQQVAVSIARAHTWILVGIGAQAMVIALILMQRRK